MAFLSNIASVYILSQQEGPMNSLLYVSQYISIVYSNPSGGTHTHVGVFVYVLDMISEACALMYSIVYVRIHFSADCIHT